MHACVSTPLSGLLSALVRRAPSGIRNVPQHTTLNLFHAYITRRMQDTGYAGEGKKREGGGWREGGEEGRGRTCSSARPTFRSRSKSGSCSTSASQYISMRRPSSFKTGIPEISCSCINRSAFRTVSLACTVTIF